MKSIINVRRSSICWRGRRESDNGRQKTRNHGYDAGCRRRAIYWLLRSPSQTVTLNPNSNQQAPDATSFFPVGGMLTAYYLKDFSPKSQDAVALQQIKERRFTYDWSVISVRQSTVAAISGLHCRALVVSSSIRLTAWLQNSKKRAERSERLMYEQSHRDYLRSGYLHHRLPVMGC